MAIKINGISIVCGYVDLGFGDQRVSLTIGQQISAETKGGRRVEGVIVHILFKLDDQEIGTIVVRHKDKEDFVLFAEISRLTLIYENDAPTIYDFVRH